MSNEEENDMDNSYNHGNMWFVTCSQWLARQAKRSGLIRGISVTSIPNPIDITPILVSKNSSRNFT